MGASQTVRVDVRGTSTGSLSKGGGLVVRLYAKRYRRKTMELEQQQL